MSLPGSDRRRGRLVGLFVVGLLGFWGIGYSLTEFTNPLTQAYGLYSRIAGDKYHRTRRESDTNMAIFHLRYAIKRKYDDAFVRNLGEFPNAWDKLIRDTADYQGPHLRGRLAEAYPMLRAPLDPWGRPWIFRIEVPEGGLESQDVAQMRLVFGSSGPDGVECGGDRSRTGCDDLIENVRFHEVPRNCLPASVSIVPWKPEVFTIPAPLR